MQFIRKRFILILCLLCVYSAYIFVHFPSRTSPNVLGASSNLSLFIQPDAGKSPLLDAIYASKKEIDIEVYLLSDNDIISSLITACQRGVVARLMLEEHPFGGGDINNKTYQDLSSTCVKVKWTNSAFSLTHEKTMIIDNEEVFILNQNLTKSSFIKNREYDIIDVNPQDVLEVKQIFDADWTRVSTNIALSNLVVSPVNARTILVSLMQSATKELFIETEVIDDPSIVQLLIEKAKTIPITIILPTFSQVSANKLVAKKLQQAGIIVKTLGSPYVHAKLIIADKKAYIGSINLTTQSMDNNREVGIIISQADIVGELQQVFISDSQLAQYVSF